MKRFYEVLSTIAGAKGGSPLPDDPSAVRELEKVLSQSDNPTIVCKFAAKPASLTDLQYLQAHMKVWGAKSTALLSALLGSVDFEDFVTEEQAFDTKWRKFYNTLAWVWKETDYAPAMPAAKLKRSVKGKGIHADPVYTPGEDVGAQSVLEGHGLYSIDPSKLDASPRSQMKIMFSGDLRFMQAVLQVSKSYLPPMGDDAGASSGQTGLQIAIASLQKLSAKKNDVKQLAKLVRASDTLRNFMKTLLLDAVGYREGADTVDADVESCNWLLDLIYGNDQLAEWMNDLLAKVGSDQVTADKQHAAGSFAAKVLMAHDGSVEGNPILGYLTTVPSTSWFSSDPHKRVTEFVRTHIAGSPHLYCAKTAAPAVLADVADVADVESGSEGSGDRLSKKKKKKRDGKSAGHMRSHSLDLSERVAVGGELLGSSGQPHVTGGVPPGSIMTPPRSGPTAGLPVNSGTAGSWGWDESPPREGRSNGLDGSLPSMPPTPAPMPTVDDQPRSGGSSPTRSATRDLPPAAASTPWHGHDDRGRPLSIDDLTGEGSSGPDMPDVSGIAPQGFVEVDKISAVVATVLALMQANGGRMPRVDNVMDSMRGEVPPTDSPAAAPIISFLYDVIPTPTKGVEGPGGDVSLDIPAPLSLLESPEPASLLKSGVGELSATGEFGQALSLLTSALGDTAASGGQALSLLASTSIYLGSTATADGVNSLLQSRVGSALGSTVGTTDGAYNSLLASTSMQATFAGSTTTPASLLESLPAEVQGSMSTMQPDEAAAVLSLLDDSATSAVDALLASAEKVAKTQPTGEAAVALAVSLLEGELEKQGTAKSPGAEETAAELLAAACRSMQAGSDLSGVCSLLQTPAKSGGKHVSFAPGPSSAPVGGDDEKSGEVITGVSLLSSLLATPVNGIGISGSGFEDTPYGPESPTRLPAPESPPTAPGVHGGVGGETTAGVLDVLGGSITDPAPQPEPRRSPSPPSVTRTPVSADLFAASSSGQPVSLTDALPLVERSDELAAALGESYDYDGHPGVTLAEALVTPKSTPGSSPLRPDGAAPPSGPGTSPNA